MKDVGLLIRTAIAASVTLLSGAAIVALQQPPASARWITAWATSQQALGTTAVTHATVRMIARVTIPGEAVRIRVDNTFGTVPLVIATAYVGLRIQGAALAAGSNRQVMFSKSASTTVPPGGSVTSDAVPMHVLGQQDLAVRLYIPGTDVRPSQHSGAQVTSYVTANGSGDAAAEEMAAPFTGTTSS